MSIIKTVKVACRENLERDCSRLIDLLYLTPDFVHVDVVKSR